MTLENRYRMLSALAAALIVMPGAAVAAVDNTSGTPTTQRAPSVLEISSSGSLYSVHAEHAVIATVISQLFGLAHQQFVLGPHVGGDVTLRLVKQPLLTVLNAICSAAMLKYQETGTGTARRITILVDESAVHAFAVSMARISADRQSQLTALQLSLAAPRIMAPGGAASRGLRNSPAPLGGFGGASTAPINGLAQAKVVQKVAELPINRFAGGLPNREVSIQVPAAHPMPMTDVLRSLTDQAGVGLVLDKTVPTGERFRFVGSIPSRTLEQALNLLAPLAHLEWYWTGSAIYISTTPNFAIYYGSSKQPKVQFGSQPALAAPARPPK
ncbi:MAG: hypothetical protein KGJ62_07625 [Armatimonadetes bacterium]|nr:hypothetical protein [Armatimonadota bacterium]MDE2207226.1 hypothetical protein [Armatimonadota bacterium]